jgi:hypothetical protein
MSSIVVQNSTFLDDFGNNQATPQQFAQLATSTSLANAQAVLGELYAFNGTPANVHAADPGDQITVGLVLERANDPTSLLASSWAVREQALADQTAIFDTYGADRATYSATLAATNAALGSPAPFDLASSIGYVSSAANGQHVSHLWNYGSNVWGFEDTFGGGDHDYNDLVVGLDFTSASGHGWLA